MTLALLTGLPVTTLALGGGWELHTVAPCPKTHGLRVLVLIDRDCTDERSGAWEACDLWPAERQRVRDHYDLGLAPLN